MKNEKIYKEKPEGTGSCKLVLMILAAILAELLLFFHFFPHPIGRALIAILLVPTVVNFLLLTPLERKTLPPASPKEPLPEPENGGKIRKFFWRLRSGFRRRYPARKRKILNFFSEHRIVTVSVLTGLFLLAAHIRFWKFWKPFYQHPVSVLIPVVFGAAFFLLLALEIWCGHLKKELKDPDCRCGFLLGNLRSQIRICKFLFLAAAVIVAMPMLDLPGVYRQYYYVLSGFFAVQSGILVIFYGIRLAKQELNSRPDLRLLVLHRKKGDLNLLGYLEDNTGITMRSLWSISLIRRLTPYALVLAAAILWLTTGIVQVAPSQQGARYRLGKLSENTLKPGLHLTLPWPLDNTQVYDTESLKEITIGYTTDQEKGDNLWTETHGGEENKLLLGGGNELVSINLRIEFKISDLCSYLRCSSAPESLLESAAYEAVTASTISTNLETLLDVDRGAFSRRFEADLTERISRYHTGLQVVDVVIESIHPPVEVAQVYQQIISAGIDAQRIILDAEAAAATVLADARTESDTKINAAKAASYESIAAAEASVAEFMASLEADQTYGGNYRYYKYLEAVEKAYSNSVLVIVGEGIDSSHLYLGSIPS